MLSILRVRDENGVVRDVLALRGEKGDPGADGTVAFDDLTDAQKAALKGEKGDTGYTPQKGIDYYTEAEKDEWMAEIKNAVTGDIEITLDGILAIQESLIGGASA